MGLRKFALFAGVALLALCTAAVHAENARPVRVASIFAFTGPAARSNQLSVEGVRFGVDEINRDGGLLDRPVELIEIDNRSTPIGAKVAAEQAGDMEADAIVGPEWSSHAIAAARVAQERRIPMITSIATHPDVTRVGDYIFRACFTDRFQGTVMARFALETLPDARDAVIFTDMTSDYSIALSDEFQKRFQALGGRILARIPYRHAQESFDDIVRKAKAADPRMLFLPGHYETGLILAAATRQGLTATPFGGDGWGTGAFLEKGGDRLRLGYFCTHWDPAVNSAASRAFLEKFHPKGGVFPSHALAYDAVSILADAIRRADSVRPSRVRDALAGTRDFEAVTGRITFDRHGDPIKSAVIMKIENGRPFFLKQVDPPREAEAAE